MVKSICRWQVSNTPDLAYAKIYANLAQFLKQCRAAFQYILPCGFKISREPWVCHFTGMIRMRHQQRDFMLWVSADKPQDVAQIAFIHANQMIIPCIIQSGHLPGGLAVAVDAMFCQLLPCRRIDPDFRFPMHWWAADAISNCSDSPALDVRSFITYSAIGLRQIFPRQINKILVMTGRSPFGLQKA